MSSDVYGRTVFITGANPRIFGVLVNLDSNRQLYSSYDTEFRKVGFRNDIDGGIPFRIKKINADGTAIEMIDAVDFLGYANKGLLKPDGKDYGPHMNLKEVIEETKPDDNPIIVVVHMKE